MPLPLLPRGQVRPGEAIRSWSVHASYPPRLVAASGTLRNGLRVSQSAGGRTPHVPGHTGACPSCARAVMAMSACGALLA